MALKKILIFIAILSVLLTTLLLPIHGAQLIVPGSNNPLDYDNSGKHTVTANSDLLVSFNTSYTPDGITFENDSRYIYSSKYLIEGVINATNTDSSYEQSYDYFWKPESSLSTAVNQYSTVADGSNLGSFRPLYSSLTFNKFGRLQDIWYNDYNLEYRPPFDDSEIPYGYTRNRVISGTYNSHGWIFSPYAFKSFNMSSNDFYCDYATLSSFIDGYGGITLPYLNSDNFETLNVYYKFDVDVSRIRVDLNSDDYENALSLYSFTVDTVEYINKSNNSYRIPLITPDIINQYLFIDDNADGSDDGFFYRISNIMVYAEMNDGGVPSSGGSNTVYVHNPIIASYDAVADANTVDKQYTHYNVMDTLFTFDSLLKNNETANEEWWEAGFNFGRGVGIDEGYEDGYADGLDVGYDQGYNTGYDTGYRQAELEGGRVDFVDWLVTAVGGFLSFEIFGFMSIGGILAVLVAISLLLLFLKFFAGG